MKLGSFSGLKDELHSKKAIGQQLAAQIDDPGNASESFASFIPQTPSSPNVPHNRRESFNKNLRY
jgi:hypothetical protein